MPVKKLFSVPTVCLTLSGLALNILLVWLTKLLGLPLYLDAVGTVIVAALGGTLPGIAVGFLSNCITAFLSVSPDPMTLYYGFLSALIAVAAAWLSRRGLLRLWRGRLLAVGLFTLIGGGVGSLVTWVLYGFSFGAGVSAPLARFLFRSLAFPRFPAQLTADILIDLADKTLTTALLILTLTLLPDSVRSKLPLGGKEPPEERKFRRHSLHTKITLIILVSSCLLSAVAVTIGTVTYRRKLIEHHSLICRDAAEMMLAKLDGDKIADFLEFGEAAPGYTETERNLMDIFSRLHYIKYMYVYQIEPDGYRVVFDLDADGLQGAAPGTVGSFDEEFPYLDGVLAGEEIPPLISDGAYGWLLTVYLPIRDSAGNTVAYAGADVDMEDITADTYTFLITMASLLFGVLILMTGFSLWYCDRRLIRPIGTLTDQARELDFEGVRIGRRVRDRAQVKTGDELEEVFKAMCRTEDAIAGHLSKIGEKNREITLMQRNIIYALANMVENRDGNTGGHIRRTASYVRLIGEGLLAAGAPGVDAEYIRSLVDSAPLHDVGKVRIPDAILNKPGRLTPEEFAVMKTHTTAGREILQSSLSGIEDRSWLSMAVDMAAYHHERWDGGGYPEGLTGEAIPLCARIMAVSDVFDALVSKRSYKEAFPAEEAFSVLRKGAGSQFDPILITLFLSCETDIREIMKQN